MRILQIINAFYPPYSSGGAAFVAYEISKALAKRGHEVTVFTTNVLNSNCLFASKKKFFNYNKINVRYFNNLLYKPSMHIYFSKELISTLKKEISDFDIVHVHEYRSYIALTTYYYAKKRGLPFVLQAHGQLPIVGSSKILKISYDFLLGYKVLKNANGVIALSRIEARQYENMGVPRERIFIVPNGIDISEYSNLPPKGAFRKKFNIPEDKKIILYLGRIHKLKGIDFLIRAYAFLNTKLNFKDAFLVIAGPDDGYLSVAKSLVQELGVSNSVLFTGSLSQQDKISAYTDASVVTYLGPFEPYGLVSLEAAACETPVIVADRTPMAEIINKGKFGFSVRYGDVISLASVLHKLLSDEKLAKSLGKKGRSYIFSNFGWDRIIENYIKIYEKVINRKI